MTCSTQALPDTQAAELGKSRWAFSEQERLLHPAFWSGQVKGTFALSVSALQVSPIVNQQVDDFHTVLPGGRVEGGVQPLAMVNVGS